jgi:hypothetical protein
MCQVHLQQSKVFIITHVFLMCRATEKHLNLHWRSASISFSLSLDPPNTNTQHQHCLKSLSDSLSILKWEYHPLFCTKITSTVKSIPNLCSRWSYSNLCIEYSLEYFVWFITRFFPSQQSITRFGEFVFICQDLWSDALWICEFVMNTSWVTYHLVQEFPVAWVSIFLLLFLISSSWRLNVESDLVISLLFPQERWISVSPIVSNNFDGNILLRLKILCFEYFGEYAGAHASSNNQILSA